VLERATAAPERSGASPPDGSAADPNPAAREEGAAAGRRRGRAALAAAAVLDLSTGRRTEQAPESEAAAAGTGEDPYPGSSRAASEAGVSRDLPEGPLTSGRLEVDAGPRTPSGTGAERSADTDTTSRASGAVAPSDSSSAPRAPVAASVLAGSRTGLPTWAERIGELLELEHRPVRAEMRIELEPAGLGHLEVRLRMHGSGLHASIVADHEQARALLVQQQHLLESALQKGAINLSQLDVDVRGDAERRQAHLPSADGREPALGGSGEAPSSEHAPAVAAEMRVGRISIRA
jgi:hypothetical protein